MKTLPQLRSFALGLAAEDQIGLIPGRSWSWLPTEKAIVFPSDQVGAWYTRPDEYLYDLGDDQPSSHVADRRVESIVIRLVELCKGVLPGGIERKVLRLALDAGIKPTDVMSLFWHAEQGRIERIMREQSAWYVQLGGFPAYGEGYRAYGTPSVADWRAKTPPLQVQLYGVLANPQWDGHDPRLVSAAAALVACDDRMDLWEAFKAHLPAIAALLQPEVEQEHEPDSGAIFSIEIDGGLPAAGPLDAPGVPVIPDTEGDVDDKDAAAVGSGEGGVGEPEDIIEGDGDADDGADLPQSISEIEDEHGSGADYEAPGGDINRCVGKNRGVANAFYADTSNIDVPYYLGLLRPTIDELLKAMGAIAGTSRAVRKTERLQLNGRLDTSRIANLLIDGDLHIFTRDRYIPKSGRVNVIFLIDDSGSMGSLSDAKLPGSIGAAYPSMSDIMATRFVSLALADAVHRIDGTCAITTINHTKITPWGPGDHKQALSRMVATGGSMPDDAMKTILAEIDCIPAPRLIVFVTDGGVCASEKIVSGSGQRLISIVPSMRGVEQEGLYGQPTIGMDESFFHNFTTELRKASGFLAARNP